MSESVHEARRRKLTRWGTRQAIAVCILTLIVIVWPELWWLIPIWLVLGLASLAVILVMFRRLRDQAERVERKLNSVEHSVR